VPANILMLKEARSQQGKVACELLIFRNCLIPCRHPHVAVHTSMIISLSTQMTVLYVLNDRANTEALCGSYQFLRICHRHFWPRVDHRESQVRGVFLCRISIAISLWSSRPSALVTVGRFLLDYQSLFPRMSGATPMWLRSTILNCTRNTSLTVLLHLGVHTDHTSMSRNRVLRSSVLIESWSDQNISSANSV